ncbi:MAG: MFS transporter [Opitutaceae bacterium]|nr:MFS transporter [Opitutaceae bacterium]
MSAGSMMILVGGLLAAKIAPTAKLATLPLAMIIVGTATSTIWVAMLLRQFGRKRGSHVGFLFSFLAAFLGYQAAVQESFPLLVATGFSMGIAVTFWQQFRFAALESLPDPKLNGPALSVMMGGGLIAAFIGPEIGARGQDLFPHLPEYAGCFVLLAGLVAIAVVVFQFSEQPPITTDRTDQPGRPLLEIVKSPQFYIPSLCAAIGFGVMSFVMTATPLTMHEVCGFDLNDTKKVIQSHIVAMFLPSLIGGHLMQRFGVGRIMVVGAILYAVVVGIGLLGQELVHFWGSLILLGVGWNFLFMGGTALLPISYKPNERFKAQAANDLVVFGTQAIASLSSGWFVFTFGWNGLLLTCLPLLTAALILAIQQARLESRSTKSE